MENKTTQDYQGKEIKPGDKLLFSVYNSLGWEHRVRGLLYSRLKISSLYELDKIESKDRITLVGFKGSVHPSHFAIVE